MANDVKKITISQNAKKFIGKIQASIVEKSDEFQDAISDLNRIVNEMPSTYETEGTKIEDKIIWLHYFSPYGDWYIVEKDKGDDGDSRQIQAFGYAKLGDDGEWGYINIEELISIPQVELDLYFEPKRFGDVIYSKENEPKREVIENYTSKDEETAESLMSIESDVWNNLGITSASQLYSDKDLIIKHKQIIDNIIRNGKKFEFTEKVHDIIEDNNYHSLNAHLALSGYYGEDEKSYYEKSLNPDFVSVYIKEVHKMDKLSEAISEATRLVSELEDKIKDPRVNQNKYALLPLIDEYQELVRKHPILYTRYMDFISDTLGAKYYMEYDLEGSVFHNNIISDGLNIWNLIPEKFKITPKIKQVEFKTNPEDKGLADIHSEFAGTDIIRPIMFATHFDSDGVTTTDAHRLIFNKKRSTYKYGNYCLTNGCFKNVSEETLEEGKFPNYKAVIPKIDDMSIMVIDHNALLLYLNTILKTKLVSNVTKMVILKIGEMDFGYNAEYLFESIKAMIKMGYNSISIAYSTPNRAVVFFNSSDSEKVNTFKADFVLLMPLMIMDESSKKPVYELSTNCVTNQGVDECLKDYEIVGKYKKEVAELKQEIKKGIAEVSKRSMTAKKLSKSISRNEIKEAIDALQVSYDISKGKHKLELKEALDALKVMYDSMGDKMEVGGYVIEQDNVVLQEIYN